MDILIVSGGTPPPESLLKEYAGKSDYIIAADSGAAPLLKYGIKTDLLLGDFDSLKEEDRLKISTDEVRIYKRQKDFSDTEAAVREALLLKPENVYMLGATGTRMDHFLTNLSQLGFLLKEGVHGEIIDPNNRIYMTDKPIEIKKEEGYISFSSFDGKVNNFTIEGFKYHLKDHTLKFGESLTVSNEFSDDTQYAEISFTSGTVIVIHSRD